MTRPNLNPGMDQTTAMLLFSALFLFFGTLLIRESNEQKTRLACVASSPKDIAWEKAVRICRGEKE